MIAMLVGINITPVYDVDLYKIEYYTEVNQKKIKCSGLICVPITTNSLRGVISCQHISLLRNFESPTEIFLETTMECVMGASLGYLSVTNDYIGFGSSSKSGLPQAYHIEVLAATE